MRQVRELLYPFPLLTLRYFVQVEELHASYSPRLACDRLFSSKPSPSDRVNSSLRHDDATLTSLRRHSSSLRQQVRQYTSYDGDAVHVYLPRAVGIFTDRP